MNLLQFLGITAVAWLLLRIWLVPLAGKRWQASSAAEKIAKAGLYSVLKSVHALAEAAVVTYSVLWCCLLVLDQLGTGFSLSFYQTLLSDLKSVRGFFSFVSGGVLGNILLIVAFAIVLLASYRRYLAAYRAEAVVQIGATAADGLAEPDRRDPAVSVPASRRIPSWFSVTLKALTSKGFIRTPVFLGRFGALLSLVILCLSFVGVAGDAIDQDVEKRISTIENNLTVASAKIGSNPSTTAAVELSPRANAGDAKSEESRQVEAVPPEGQDRLSDASAEAVARLFLDAYLQSPTFNNVVRPQLEAAADRIKGAPVSQKAQTATKKFAQLIRAEFQAKPGALEAGLKELVADYSKPQPASAAFRTLLEAALDPAIGDLLPATDDKLLAVLGKSGSKGLQSAIWETIDVTYDGFKKRVANGSSLKDALAYVKTLELKAGAIAVGVITGVFEGSGVSTHGVAGASAPDVAVDSYKFDPGKSLGESLEVISAAESSERKLRGGLPKETEERLALEQRFKEHIALRNEILKDPRSEKALAEMIKKSAALQAAKSEKTVLMRVLKFVLRRGH